MQVKRFLFLLLVSFFAAAVAAVFILFFERDWVDLACFERLKGNSPTVICDAEGTVIASLTVDKRAPINYDDLPPKLVHAFVAAEDHRFFYPDYINYVKWLRPFDSRHPPGLSFQILHLLEFPWGHWDSRLIQLMPVVLVLL